jgi:hypothetical protein
MQTCIFTTSLSTSPPYMIVACHDQSSTMCVNYQDYSKAVIRCQDPDILAFSMEYFSKRVERKGKLRAPLNVCKACGETIIYLVKKL